MKALKYFVILSVSTLSYGNTIHSDPNIILREMLIEMQIVQVMYNSKYMKIEDSINSINSNLVTSTSTEDKVNLLLRKDQLQDQLAIIQLNNLSDISKIRYIKGVQIIRILYEKVLSLDHHFASVRTFSEISKMANPNQYPEYAKLTDILKAKKDKKMGKQKKQPIIFLLQHT